MFIDTLHDYEQLREELRLHAGKARRYVVLHDTTTFGERGETPGHRGLWPAVEEFLALGAVPPQRPPRCENNHGLTVLEAVGAAVPDRDSGAGLTPARPPAAAAAEADGVRPAGPHVAVVSTVHNEEDLIAPFLEHYFGMGVGAIILLANDCTDRTLERTARYSGVEVVPLDSGGELDCALRRDALDARRRALAGRFDWVLLVDADEFLVPKEGGLQETLLRHDGRDVLGSKGWDVMQGPDEPPFDPSAPLLPQATVGPARPGVRQAGGPSARSEPPPGGRPALPGRARAAPGGGPVLPPAPGPLRRGRLPESAGVR